jgi:tetratricopeptide (TPR) repeat protein
MPALPRRLQRRHGQDVAQAIALAGARQNAPRLAQAYNLMADLKYRHGSYNEMKYFASQVVTQLAEQIPVDELAHAYRWLGVVATTLGDYEVAIDHLRQAEMLNRQVQNKDRLARVLESMAFVYYLQKKLELALTYMRQSVELSRDFSIPANTASSLSNIALVEFQLGRPFDALATLEEAIKIVRQVSRNFLAVFLANKGEILCYLGEFSEAQECFAEANDLFNIMDDDSGLLEVCLLQAYEYYCALKEWDLARVLLKRAEELITLRPDFEPEASARLLIALSTVSLANDDFLAAKQQAIEALALVEEKEITWWRPAVYNLYARVSLALGEIEQAFQAAQSGITAVSNGGCPDYLPLLFLAMGEAKPEKRLEYLQDCVLAAEKRARYVDRVHCLQIAEIEMMK